MGHLGSRWNRIPTFGDRGFGISLSPFSIVGYRLVGAGRNNKTCFPSGQPSRCRNKKATRMRECNDTETRANEPRDVYKRACHPPRAGTREPASAFSRKGNRIPRFTVLGSRVCTSDTVYEVRMCESSAVTHTQFIPHRTVSDV